MGAVEAKKTYSSDFERIYPLLKEFSSPYSCDEWRKIFLYQWDGVENHVGYHLEIGGQAVGFVGLIFSCRYKDNDKYKFCNITSLIVKEAFRTATILLIRKLGCLKDTIYTVFRPIDESYQLFTRMGFSVCEKQYRILPTINGLLSRRSKVDVYHGSALMDKIDIEHQRIVLDHVGHQIRSILFDLNGDKCLIMYKIVRQTYYRISIQKIHLLYISDRALFNKYTYPILRFFYHQFGLFSAVYVDCRFLQGRYLPLSVVKRVTPPKVLFRNPHKYPIEIDELYSETILLG